jgi:hypothetical protein
MKVMNKLDSNLKWHSELLNMADLNLYLKEKKSRII